MDYFHILGSRTVFIEMRYRSVGNSHHFHTLWRHIWRTEQACRVSCSAVARNYPAVMRLLSISEGLDVRRRKEGLIIAKLPKDNGQ